MSKEPIFETVNVFEALGCYSTQISVECAFKEQPESVNKILGVTAFPTIIGSAIIDGQVKFSGRAIFAVCYESVDGEVLKSECAGEFNGEINDENIKNGVTKISVSVIKVSADTSGRFIASAHLQITAKIGAEKEIKALCGGDDLITDIKEIPIVKRYGLKQGSYPVEEELEVNYAISNVLLHTSKIALTAVQCGIGTVIVDGEISLSLLLLQNQNKSDIIRENFVIPFRLETDCEEAMPSMNATANIFISAVKFDISVDENQNRSVIGALFTVGIDGEVFCESFVNVALDAYSVNEETELETESCEYDCDAVTKSYLTKAVVRAPINELPAGVRLICCGLENATDITYLRYDGKLKITFVLTAGVLFKDGDGKNFAETLETPCEIELDCDFENVCDICVAVRSASARLISLTEADLEVDIRIGVTAKKTQNFKYVKNVAFLGEKSQETAAISVYIAAEGDNLWNLSKRLNICPDALIETNKDLQFPLTGSERIVVYRKK